MPTTIEEAFRLTFEQPAPAVPTTIEEAFRMAFDEPSVPTTIEEAIYGGGYLPHVGPSCFAAALQTIFLLLLASIVP